MKIKERDRKISQIKEKEAKSENINQEDKKKWEKQQMEDAKDEESRQKRHSIHIWSFLSLNYENSVFDFFSILNAFLNSWDHDLT